MSEVNENENIENESGENPPPAEDPIKNLKSEFDRKMGNTTSKLDQLNAQLNAVLETIQASQKPAAPEKSLKDLAFDDPEEYARQIEERAVKRAEEKVTKQVQLSQATQSVVADIQAKYAEFAQEGSDAARLAIQKAAQLPPHLRGTPEGAKMVLLETVADLGLVPVSKKKQSSNDDFSLSGQSKPASSRKAPGDNLKDVDATTLAWMDLLDPSYKNDPKRVEALKKISNRKSWSKYE